MSNKKTLAFRQKRNIIVIAAAILLLAALLLVVRYLVSVYDYTDVDGTKYTIKRRDGVYGLFDTNGYQLDTTVEDGNLYYVTDAGTMVSVSDDGKATVYAAVDTDDGEAVSSYKRLLVFPKVESSEVQSLRVTNEHGTYTFEKKNGSVVLKGYEYVAYDQKSYQSMIAFLGSLVTMEKYPESTVRKYGLSEYGLETPQATYTIISTSGKTYTVDIGDAIVSGNGYYAKLEGRETVYIINAYYALTLEPVESYIQPIMADGLTINNYPEVYNFKLYNYTYDADGKPKAENLTALTYWDYAERENTEFQTQSYKMLDDRLACFMPNSDSVTTTMSNFASMENAKVVKLGATDAVRKQYGLDKPAKLLTYDFVLTDSKTGEKTYLRYFYWFSNITEQGTYYAVVDAQTSTDNENFYSASAKYDYILEIGRSMIPMMEWNAIDWVEAYYFHRPIMLIDRIEFETPDGTIVFRLTAGKDDIERITATMNGETRDVDIKQFKNLYRNMLYGVLFDKTGKTDEELAAVVADPARKQLSYRVVTSLKSLDYTYTFYNLAESRSYITIHDNIGDVGGGGDFFVLTNDVMKTVRDAKNVFDGKEVTVLS